MSTDLRTAVRAANAQSMEAFGRGGAAGLVALYANGGQVCFRATLQYAAFCDNSAGPVQTASQWRARRQTRAHGVRGIDRSASVGSGGIVCALLSRILGTAEAEVLVSVRRITLPPVRGTQAPRAAAPRATSVDSRP